MHNKDRQCQRSRSVVLNLYLLAGTDRGVRGFHEFLLTMTSLFADQGCRLFTDLCLLKILNAKRNALFLNCSFFLDSGGALQKNYFLQFSVFLSTI